MRNDVILRVSDFLESYTKSLSGVPGIGPTLKNPTEEEIVAALIAAAYGLCKSPETYSAFGTAAKAALMMMDRVNIPYDGHYIELETAFQRKHGRPSPTEEARLIRDTGGLPGWTQEEAEQRFKDHPEERQYIRFPAGYAIPPERERVARTLAAKDYDRFAATNGTPDYHQGVFLTNYPTKESYVDEWWEERYADAGC